VIDWEFVHFPWDSSNEKGGRKPDKSNSFALSLTVWNLRIIRKL
jgi:hypothetical protein